MKIYAQFTGCQRNSGPLQEEVPSKKSQLGPWGFVRHGPLGRCIAAQREEGSLAPLLYYSAPPSESIND